MFVRTRDPGQYGGFHGQELTAACSRSHIGVTTRVAPIVISPSARTVSIPRNALAPLDPLELVHPELRPALIALTGRDPKALTIRAEIVSADQLRAMLPELPGLGRRHIACARRRRCQRRPIRFCLAAGQVSNYTSAAAMLSSLPAAEWPLAGKGYEADWFGNTLIDQGIRLCIPGRRSRGTRAI